MIRSMLLAATCALALGVYGGVFAQEPLPDVQALTAAAAKGDAEAAYRLGKLYASGQGVKRSMAEAIRLHKLAAAQGHVGAMQSLGTLHAFGAYADDAESFRWYRMAAERGDLIAIKITAMRYRNGRGVTRNDKEAARLFKLVSGEWDAALALAEMYERGEGVAKNSLEAARLYRIVADMGYPAGMNGLGYLYDQGDGVQRDDAEAVRWYRMAADKGNHESQNRLGVMYQLGRGVPKNDAEAVRLYRLSAEKGNAVAQSNLAAMYSNGRGVAKNEVEATRLYKTSAEKDYPKAARILGSRYQNGLGVARNNDEASRWLEKAAAQGDVEAMYRLGVLYAEVEWPTPRDSQAAQWFRKAADAGHVAAMYGLAYLHEHGRGVARSETAARQWYKRAADKGNTPAAAALAALTGKRSPAAGGTPGLPTTSGKEQVTVTRLPAPKDGPWALSDNWRRREATHSALMSNIRKRAAAFNLEPFDVPERCYSVTERRIYGTSYSYEQVGPRHSDVDKTATATVIGTENTHRFTCPQVTYAYECITEGPNWNYVLLSETHVIRPGDVFDYDRMKSLGQSTHEGVCYRTR